MIRAQMKPMKPPHVEKKLRKVYTKRRQHVKGLVKNLSNIAIDEINKLNEIAEILLHEEADNPITYKNEDEESESQI